MSCTIGKQLVLQRERPWNGVFHVTTTSKTNAKISLIVEFK